MWVMVEGEKVPLRKTALLKYYDLSHKSAKGSRNGRQFHRDEFIRCTRCGKQRRFRLRSKEECRIYHDCVAKHNWTCADLTTNRYVLQLLMLINSLVREKSLVEYQYGISTKY